MGLNKRLVILPLDKSRCPCVFIDNPDSNSRSWKIPLAPTSADLTSFTTPFGRQFRRLLFFGRSCASENFHRRMLQLSKDK